MGFEPPPSQTRSGCANHYTIEGVDVTDLIDRYGTFEMTYGRFYMVMSCVRFPPDVALCIQSKEFNIRLIRPQNLLPHALKVFHVPFYKLQACCHVPISQEWLSSGHSPIKLRL